MNILLVNAPAPLEAAFREQGRQVTNFALKGGRYSMHSLLEGQSPDLFMQAESLGTRVFITGLEHSPCPTLFWAIDSHLNLFWQRWYSMLFDLVLTPHPSLFQPLPQNCRPKDVRLMAWFGQKRSWTPHAQRAHALAFCGRLTEHRPIRSLLVELLEPEGLHLEKDIPVETMMSMYDQSRVAPNEAIAMESNFRLLEAASSGCLVLSQDVGDDQNCLLQPGKEFLIYYDGLELLDQVRWAASRPEAAEAMGLAAMRRIQAEHLPRHRARMILDLAAVTSQNRLRGHEAALAFWLTITPRVRNRSLPASRSQRAAQGLELLRKAPASAKTDQRQRALALAVFGQILCLLAESDLAEAREQALVLCREASLPQNTPERPLRDLNYLFDNAPPAKAPDIAAPATALALREGQLPLARALRLLGASKKGEVPGANALALCLQWAQDLEQNGKIFLAGSGYDPAKGLLPEDAFGWLIFAKCLSPESWSDLLPRRVRVFAASPALVHAHMGTLAEYSLAEADNWRVQFDYGLACLKCMRVEAGLYELTKAGELAGARGEARAFAARLKGLRPELQRLFTAQPHAECGPGPRTKETWGSQD